jgi:uncharacterized YccA/Bax inhibitor family protein
MSNGTIEALQQAQEAHDKAAAGALTAAGGQPWSADLVTTLTLATLGFTLVVIIIAGVLLWRAAASPAHVLRVTGILSILGFATLLLVAGYGNEQLTPIVGLFGAIAGYLLGRDSRGPEAGAADASRASAQGAPPAAERGEPVAEPRQER